MKRCVFVIAVTLQLFFLFDSAKGHGMMLNPVGRGSRWRVDKTAPANYDDMSNYCGGVHTMYKKIHGGKCGICGDNYGSRTPRAHELGGKYGGSGVIVQTYSSGSQNEFIFKITALHQGFVYFELCNLDKDGSESEECFAKNRLQFGQGGDKYYVKSRGEHRPTVVLPSNLTCDHCIVRWTYYAGNNVHVCDDGVQRKGCGPQETFKNCADIRIKP